MSVRLAEPQEVCREGQKRVEIKVGIYSKTRCTASHRGHPAAQICSAVQRNVKGDRLVEYT
jgi:hypothetical protein